MWYICGMVIEDIIQQEYITLPEARYVIQEYWAEVNDVDSTGRPSLSSNEFNLLMNNYYVRAKEYYLKKYNLEITNLYNVRYRAED